jgi:hypothetical protein
VALKNHSNLLALIAVNSILSSELAQQTDLDDEAQLIDFNRNDGNRLGSI